MEMHSTQLILWYSVLNRLEKMTTRQVQESSNASTLNSYETIRGLLSIGGVIREAWGNKLLLWRHRPIAMTL